MRAAVYVLRQVLKRDRAAFRVAGALVRRQCVLLPVGQHHLFGKLPRADLRALRVEQNGDRHVKLFSQLFHHIGAALLLLMRAVRHIQARHVHAAQISSRSTASSSVEGPSVHTILVFLIYIDPFHFRRPHGLHISVGYFSLL